jgi:hypothetical protein
VMSRSAKRIRIPLFKGPLDGLELEFRPGDVVNAFQYLPDERDVDLWHCYGYISVLYGEPTPCFGYIYSTREPPLDDE